MRRNIFLYDDIIPIGRQRRQCLLLFSLQSLFAQNSNECTFCIGFIYTFPNNYNLHTNENCGDRWMNGEKRSLLVHSHAHSHIHNTHTNLRCFSTLFFVRIFSIFNLIKIEVLHFANRTTVAHQKHRVLPECSDAEGEWEELDVNGRRSEHSRRIVCHSCSEICSCNGRTYHMYKNMRQRSSIKEERERERVVACTHIEVN